MSHALLNHFWFRLFIFLHPLGVFTLVLSPQQIQVHLGGEAGDSSAFKWEEAHAEKREKWQWLRSSWKISFKRNLPYFRLRYVHPSPVASACLKSWSVLPNQSLLLKYCTVSLCFRLMHKKRACSRRCRGEQLLLYKVLLPPLFSVKGLIRYIACGFNVLTWRHCQGGGLQFWRGSISVNLGREFVMIPFVECVSYVAIY